MSKRKEGRGREGEGRRKSKARDEVLLLKTHTYPVMHFQLGLIFSNFQNLPK